MNGALDKKVYFKLIHQNAIKTETPKISNNYDNSTTCSLNFSSDCQNITHNTPPFHAIFPTPPPPMEGNDLSVIIDEISFQFNNTPIILDEI